MLPTSGLERLVEKVVKAGLKAKPELGIQIGSGGDSGEAELAAESKKDIGDLVDRGKRALDAGASIIMIESEGITENVTEWNTGAAASIITGLGLENVMYEAAAGPVCEWYIKNYGNEVNLFVDHSQILQLEGLRQNLWGNKSTWGRVINPAPRGLGSGTRRSSALRIGICVPPARASAYESTSRRSSAFTT